MEDPTPHPEEAASDLGFSRDRHPLARKSGKPDLRAAVSKDAAAMPQHLGLTLRDAAPIAPTASAEPTTLRKIDPRVAPSATRMPISGVRCTTEYQSEEHTSELQSRFGISYAVFCFKKKK